MICAACHRDIQATPCERCGEDPALEGRWQLTEALGRGGQACTWRARDLAGGADVAVKELSLLRVTDWKTVELFQREARVLEGLRHPGIPAYHADLTIEKGRHVTFYLVQELVPGASLSVEEPWDEPSVLRLLAEVGEILVYLQDRRPPVLHRDIKPSNIVRRPDGSFALIDFGIARASVEGTLGGSTIAGTFGTMAPEQLRGEASPASDIYGLGATALSLLAGKDAATLLDSARPGAWKRHVTLSGPLRGLLESMLNPDPARRLPGARELLSALESVPHVARRRGERGAPAETPRALSRETKPRRTAPPSARQTAREKSWGEGQSAQANLDERLRLGSRRRRRPPRWLDSLRSFNRSPLQGLVALGAAGLLSWACCLGLVLGAGVLHIVVPVVPTLELGAWVLSAVAATVSGTAVVIVVLLFVGLRLEARATGESAASLARIGRLRWGHVRSLVRSLLAPFPPFYVVLLPAGLLAAIPLAGLIHLTGLGPGTPIEQSIRAMAALWLAHVLGHLLVPQLRGWRRLVPILAPVWPERSLRRELIRVAGRAIFFGKDEVKELERLRRRLAGGLTTEQREHLALIEGMARARETRFGHGLQALLARLEQDVAPTRRGARALWWMADEAWSAETPDAALAFAELAERFEATSQAGSER